MMYTLEEQNGKLYAKEETINEWEPRKDILWYELVTPYQKFVSWFASEEIARVLLGDTLYPNDSASSPTIWHDKRGWKWISVCATHAGQKQKPDIIEFEPIPMPVVKSRKPLVWHKGAWHKETAKGLVKIV